MTFEEFLIKKKIDAIQLKAKEEAFFSEFESHFLQMGEKSFDHSKKFWFNKLRRAYHLKEEPKPVKEEIGIPAIVQEKSSTQEINQEKPAYIPRFKASTVQKDDQLAQKIEPNPSPAYVPRFKAAIQVEKVVEDVKLDEEPTSEDTAKPVYKPRFKATIPASEEKKSEDLEKVIPQSNEQAKPAYKPRFKPGITKKDTDSE